MNRHRLRRLIPATCVVAAVVLAGATWFVSGAIVSPANRLVGSPPSEYSVESVVIESETGSDLAAWYIPREGATATVILLHPIRTDRRAMLGRSKVLHDAGYAILLVDLPAHGESPGENITAGYLERFGVGPSVDFVRERTPDHRIGIVGWSLGGAAALLASPPRIDALVLESVYPTLEEAVHNRVAIRLGVLSRVLTPVLLAQLKPRLGISPALVRPIDHVRSIGCPVLIAAGDCDAHTTLPETRRLFETANEPKELVLFEGAAHQDLLQYDPHKYREIVSFLDVHLRGIEPHVE